MKDRSHADATGTTSDSELDQRTDRRIAELALENARLYQAIAARDAFLAVAAHELRNPMTPILGRVTLLQRALTRGEMSHDDVVSGLDKIEKLVVQFIKRATTLLDVSRKSSDRWNVECVPMNLGQTVSEIVESFQPAAVHAGTSLHFAASPTLDMQVFGDRLAVEQVIENLISNAIKYGGNTPITVAVSSILEGSVGCVSVRDAGPGIPAEHQVRIFERYERALEPGVEIGGYGVGLWIVKNLCAAMGGGISVSSRPGEGTTFVVTLPLVNNKDFA